MKNLEQQILDTIQKQNRVFDTNLLKQYEITQQTFNSFVEKGFGKHRGYCLKTIDIEELQPCSFSKHKNVN